MHGKAAAHVTVDKYFKPINSFFTQRQAGLNYDIIVRPLPGQGETVRRHVLQFLPLGINKTHPETVLPLIPVPANHQVTIMHARKTLCVNAIKYPYQGIFSLYTLHIVTHNKTA